MVASAPGPGERDSHVQLELDRLCQVVGCAIKTDVVRRRLINYEEEHKVKACFFLRLPNSYDHKRSHNEKAANATHFKADGGEDNKAGFAFVREADAVLLACPRWNDISRHRRLLAVRGVAHRTSGSKFYV